MDRRSLLAAGGAMIVAGPAWAAVNKIRVDAQPSLAGLHQTIARIEASSSGRLGVAIHETGTGRRFAYRGDEAFQMMSTVKLLIAGATLARVQQGRERLDRRLDVPTASVSGWSPFSARRAGSSATVLELCRAIMIDSDNGAADLLLAALGGTGRLMQFIRDIGDETTRFESGHAALLEAELGATTPMAMVDNAQRLWLGTVLAPVHREQLLSWAIASRTGRARLRSGLPSGWRSGAKSGTGDPGISNDVAVFWPAGRKPVVVASYLAGTELDATAANAVHARVARALVAAI
jgi:beta-lactamase class A